MANGVDCWLPSVTRENGPSDFPLGVSDVPPPIHRTFDVNVASPDEPFRRWVKVSCWMEMHEYPGCGSMDTCMCVLSRPNEWKTQLPFGIICEGDLCRMDRTERQEHEGRRYIGADQALDGIT